MKKHPLRKPVKKLTATDEDASFSGWAIVELMGHRKLAGHVSEVTIAGAAMLRLDVPSDPPVTQFYGGSAIYCITPTTEELARKVAAASRPTPVHAYGLPAPPPTAQEIEDSIEGLDGNRDGEPDDDEFDADTGGQHDDELTDDDSPL